MKYFSSNRLYNSVCLASAIFTTLNIALFLAPNPANAIATRGKSKLSIEVFTKCIGKGKNPGKIATAVCTALAIAADPPAEGITDISTSISYNPSEWIFKSELSGFLCEFSISGDCPLDNPLVGTIPIEDTPDINFNTGSPLPNSTTSLINDSVNGLVTLTYKLGEPLDSSGEKNFFSFYFEAVTPVSVSAITFYDRPGNYNFTQLNSSCNATSNGVTTTCGSNNPIEGFDITTVPEPTSTISLFTLGILGTVLAFNHRRKLSQSNNK